MKSIFLILSNILAVILGMIVAFGTVWFTLPGIQTTDLGVFILGSISTTALF